MSKVEGAQESFAVHSCNYAAVSYEWESWLLVPGAECSWRMLGRDAGVGNFRTFRNNELEYS